MNGEHSEHHESEHSKPKSHEGSESHEGSTSHEGTTSQKGTTSVPDTTSQQGTTGLPPDTTQPPAETGTTPPPAAATKTPLENAASNLSSVLGPVDIPGMTKGVGDNIAANTIKATLSDPTQSLASPWENYAKGIFATEKQRQDSADLDWNDDCAPALQQLPDIEKTLNDWQTLKQTNPFDQQGLTDLANRLAQDAQEYQWVIENGMKGFSSQAQMQLRWGLSIVCAEVGRQAEEMKDPLTIITSGLDKLTPTLLAEQAKAGRTPTGPRQQYDNALKITPPDQVWSKAKTAGTGLITNKAAGKEIQAVFKSDFGSVLKSWNSIMRSSKIDSVKLIAATQKVTDVLTLYDQKLTDIGTRYPADAGAILTLREALHAIAGKVASDTKWIAAQGAFDPIS